MAIVYLCEFNIFFRGHTFFFFFFVKNNTISCCCRKIINNEVHHSGSFLHYTTAGWFKFDSNWDFLPTPCWFQKVLLDVRDWPLDAHFSNLSLLNLPWNSEWKRKHDPVLTWNKPAHSPPCHHRIYWLIYQRLLIIHSTMCVWWRL